MLALSILCSAFDNRAKPIQAVKRFSVVAGLRFPNGSPVLFNPPPLGFRFTKFGILPANLGQPHRLKPGILLSHAQSVGRLDRPSWRVSPERITRPLSTNCGHDQSDAKRDLEDLVLAKPR